MSEEDLQLLITLDDPGDEPEEDNFHVHEKSTLEYWLDQPCQLEQGADASATEMTFGQGNWTCSISRLSGTTGSNDDVIESPGKRFDIEVCTVIQRKDGQIVERKVFYDLAGMQKQIGIT